MLRILFRRDFGLVWLAGLISISGSWMLAVALPITVYEMTGSATATSGSVIATLIPRFLLGSFAGVFVDRWDRKWTMVLANLGRAVVVLALILVNDATHLPILYAVAFVNSSLSQFFGPAENAFLPHLVGSENDLPTANALNALNNNLAGFFGPALGGVITAWSGLSGIVMTNSLTFALGAGLVALVSASGKIREPEQVSDESAPDLENMWRKLLREWVAGFGVIKNDRDLGSITVVACVVATSAAAGTALLPVFVADALDGGAKEVGLILSAQAIGGFAGALAIATIASRVSRYWLLGGGFVLLGVGQLILYGYPLLLGGIAIALVMSMLIGGPISAVNTSSQTIIQISTPDRFRGRVFSAIDTSMALVGLTMTPLASLMADLVGVVPILLGLTIPLLVGGAIMLARMPRSAPDHVAADV